MNFTYFEEMFDSIKKQAIDFTPKLIISIFIFIIFYVIASYIQGFLISDKKNIIPGTEQINLSVSDINQLKTTSTSDDFKTNLVFYQIGWIIYYSIITIGIIFALVNLGFNIGTILTILASLGLAIGLALQETLKNIISGIYLAITNPYKLTDYISIKSLGSLNPIVGTVIDFNLYYTTIIDLKTNQITVIPNSTIQNNLVTNFSRTL